MSRALRVEFDGAVYHVMSRGVGRMRTFCDDEVVEQLVADQFGGEVPRRQRRLVLYALRKHSRLRPSEIARRCDRTPAAVSLAVRDLDREASENPALAKKLKSLAKAIARSSMISAENEPII